MATPLTGEARIPRFSSAKSAWGGMVTGYQASVFMPPPFGNYNVLVPFEAARSMSEIANVVEAYRESDGTPPTDPNPDVGDAPFQLPPMRQGIADRGGDPFVRSSLRAFPCYSDTWRSE